MKDSFVKTTPEELEKRVNTASQMLAEFPSRLRKAVRDILPAWLRFAEPTWKILYERALEVEEEQHEKRLAALKVVIDAKRKVCRHAQTHYDPDPSGNHDSTTTCLICGLEL